MLKFYAKRGVYLKRHRDLVKVALFFISVPIICQHQVYAKNDAAEGPILVKAPTYKPVVSPNTAKRGRAIYAAESCSQCHSIEGKGGCLAPPFDAIGVRRSKQFIFSRIADTPEALRRFHELYQTPELMPHLRVSEKTAKAITEYLVSLPAPKDGFKIATHKVGAEKTNDAVVTAAPTASELENGKRLFYERGCMACHSIGDLGGNFAPRLDGIKERRDRGFVTTRISDAEFFVQKYPDEYGERGTLMVPSGLNAQEIKSIADYLMSLPKQTHKP